ncbi:MAG: 16S rRNA (guanine(527)-N(7))-methyltransferase RsmG [Jiangellaceae bacterium]
MPDPDDGAPDHRRAVSRETRPQTERSSVAAPPAPPAAQAVFGDRLGLAVHYVALLAGAGIERGLIGPREVPRLWDRHVLNCAVVHDALVPGSTVADVGSGAGLPGIVLAIVRPDVRVTLVEPLLRRSTFLTEVVEVLALGNATVVRGRAEELAGEVRVEAVTARAVAPLARLAGWSLPLLSPGGRLLAIKGESVVDEVAAASVRLRTMGATSWSVQEFGVGIVDPPTRVAVVEVGAEVGKAVSRSPHAHGRQGWGRGYGQRRRRGRT